MSLYTLKDIIEKRGKEYTKKYLSENVLITEKLDTFRFLFEIKKDKIIFYKKDYKPLDIIERTITNLWEDIITDIPKLIGNNKIEENMIFGVSYCPNTQPLRVTYNNLDKYILTDITKKRNNKSIYTYDIDVVNEYATKLNMGKPPVIFNGKLSESQIDDLLLYATTMINDKYKGFNQYINENFKKSYSNENIIEGIIINNDNISCQLITPEFELLNYLYENASDNRVFYELIMLNLNNFMSSYNLPLLNESSYESKYLAITSDIFNKYIKTFDVNGIDNSLLSPPQWGYKHSLNKTFISNKETLSLLESELNESIYKIIINAFRKNKKAYGLLNESCVNNFNSYVSLINNICSLSNINESDNIGVEIVKVKRAMSDTDNMRIISSIQKAFDNISSTNKKGSQQCVIYLTTFMPFSNSQLDNIKFLHEQYNVPVIISAISSKKRMNGKEFIPSDDIIYSQMLSINNNYKDICPAFFFMNNLDLKTIFDFTRPKYEPILLVTDIGRKADFLNQLYYHEEIMNNNIGVEKMFNIIELENKDDFNVLRSLEDSDAVKFNMLTPECIHSYWNSILNEYRIWNQSILDAKTKNK